MGRNDAAIVAVCDAGPLIHLDELEARDLLDDFALVVPEAVLREVRKHRSASAEWAASNAEVENSALPPDSAFRALVSALSLDEGEQHALALARNREGCMLFTDDAAARLAAERERIHVHGTIGVLLRAIRRRHRTPPEVMTLLQSIPSKSTLYIRSNLLDEIIAQVAQEFGISP